MKTAKYILASLLAVMTLAACDKDGDIIVTSGAQAVELSGSGDVVIDKNYATGLALTLNWTDNSRLSSSDERVWLPVGTTVNTLQFSATDDFASPIEIQTESGTTSIQFTAEALNSLVGRVGLASDVASTLYIRMSSVLANNVEPQYSNVLEMQVTPYSIDMSVAFVLDASKNDTGVTLSSPNSDGIYSGFIGASGWYNWWLLEGNGITWGNVAIDGKPFIISSDGGAWNFWYPGQAGCYYTVVNTVKQEWSALYIPSLTVSGDITGEMTYDRKANKWMLSYTATQSGTATIRVAGTGSQYNATTGTDDASAVSTPVAFAVEDGKLVLADEASDITINVAAAGDVTLAIDLSDPTAWKCEVSEGSEAPVEIAKQLYILGNDDTWNYDQYLTLYDEDNLCYAAAVNFSCSWGYYFSKEFQGWDHVNQDPESEEMKLIEGGTDENNIQAPGTGLYVTVASLGWMSYWYAMSDPITSVSCTGFNDDWNLIEMTADAEQVGVYTAQVTATGDTPWGAQVLLNGSWDYWFGTCADGALLWSKKENGNPTGWEAGKTYTFTVDLRKCTYSLTE
ncbi:MAG: DUF5114 domain-containing protein [Bacteroidales bacterium]|jgi:hypothetical protein|nr:DUF5114 domain-containing protein [Bacteroidales bacterium]